MVTDKFMSVKNKRTAKSWWREDFQDKGQKGLGIQEDFTYSGFAGHNIKTGLKYKSVTLRDRTATL